MKCKVFISTPSTLSGSVNRWLDEGDYIIEHMTQSYNDGTNNVILTVIYTEIIDNFKTAFMESEFETDFEETKKK